LRRIELLLLGVRDKRNDSASNADNVRQDAEEIVTTTMPSAFVVVVKTLKFDAAVFRAVLHYPCENLRVFRKSLSCGGRLSRYRRGFLLTYCREHVGNLIQISLEMHGNNRSFGIVAVTREVVHDPPSFF